MKVGSYVYNTLSRFARRIIDRMRTNRDMWFLMFTATWGVLISIAIYLVIQANWARLKDPQWLLGIATVIWFLVFAYKQAKKIDEKAENEEKDRHNVLLAELRGIREDLKKR